MDYESEHSSDDEEGMFSVFDGAGSEDEDDYSHVFREPLYIPDRELGVEIGEEETEELVNRLVPIPNVIQVVEESVGAYSGLRYTPPTRTTTIRDGDVVRLNRALTNNLEIVFRLLGCRDLWSLVARGDLMIHGSFLLAVLEHFPKRSHNLRLSEMSIRLVCNRVFRPQDVARLGFTDPVMNQVPARLGVRACDVTDPRLANKLPTRVKLYDSLREQGIQVRSETLLNTYFTDYKLYVLRPNQFVARVFGANYVLHKRSASKLIDRGYVMERRQGWVRDLEMYLSSFLPRDDENMIFTNRFPEGIVCEPGEKRRDTFPSTVLCELLNLEFGNSSQIRTGLLLANLRRASESGGA